MINYFKPNRFIEVGLGYPSIVALDTCEMSNLNTKIIFIEPFPNLILSLLSSKDKPHEIILRK